MITVATAAGPQEYVFRRKATPLRLGGSASRRAARHAGERATRSAHRAGLSAFHPQADRAVDQDSARSTTGNVGFLRKDAASGAPPPRRSSYGRLSVDMLHIILGSTVPVFFVMAVGYLAGWTRDIDNHHVAELNALAMDFALPAALFVAMVRTPRAQLLQQRALMVVLVVAMLVIYGLALLLLTRVFKSDSREAAVMSLTTAFPNLASAGLSPALCHTLGLCPARSRPSRGSRGRCRAPVGSSRPQSGAASRPKERPI